MSAKITGYASAALAALILSACSLGMPQATANQPVPLTEAPADTATTSTTEIQTGEDLPTEIADFDIDPDELGFGFKVSRSDMEEMRDASKFYDTYFSDTKTLGFARETPPEFIGIYIGLLLDNSASDELDRTIDAFKIEEIAPEDTTGEAFLVDELGNNSLGFTGTSNPVSGSNQWRTVAVIYRDHAVFVRLGVSYMDGSTPPISTEDLLALIKKHTDPINNAKR